MLKHQPATPAGIKRAEKALRELSPQEILALATGLGETFKQRIAKGQGTQEDFALHNAINRQLSGKQ